jgi:hypothetical protein
MRNSNGKALIATTHAKCDDSVTRKMNRKVLEVSITPTPGPAVRLMQSLIQLIPWTFILGS